MPSPPYELVTDMARVEQIAASIAGAGELAFDIEFVSEGRYIPELALIQLAWGEVDEPTIALIDCANLVPEPIFELIADAQIATIAHAAKQDLGLLAARYGVRAQGLWDTQIAAAFVGLGEQIGYGKLVAAELDIHLDKGAQFTAWLDRPLSARQVRYAVNDVLYLPRVWRRLKTELDRRGRLRWVREESDVLVRDCERVPDEADAYKAIKAYRGMTPKALGALRELAAWRLRTAIAKNKPLSWLLPEKAMVELCRNLPGTVRDLKRVRGIGEGTVRRYGEEIIDHLRAGAAKPVTLEKQGRPRQLSSRGQSWAAIASSLIQSLAAREHIAPRFVGTRADAEELVLWHETPEQERDGAQVALLSGWRRELAGDALLRWLNGAAAVVADPESPGGLRLVDETGQADPK